MVLVIVLYVLFTAMIFMHSAIMIDNPYPFFVAGFRTLIGSAILFGIQAFTGKSLLLFGINKRQFITLFLHGIVLYTFSLAGFAAGMQTIDGITACFILSTAPFLTALILYFRDKETLSLKKVMGLILGFLAIIPIILFQNEGTGAFTITWGHSIFFAANICYVYGWILAKDLLRIASQYSPTLLNAYAMLIGGICSTLLYMFIHSSYVPPMVTDNFWYLLIIFTIATIVNYNLYAYLLRFYSATFLSFAGFLEPALGLLYGSLWLGKPITLLNMSALGILGFGLYLFYQQELISIKSKNM